MILTLGVLRRFIFGLSNQQGRFVARGFNIESPARERLEIVARTVIEHYNTALEEGYGEALQTRLRFVDPELHGFACEGSAMGLFMRIPGQADHRFRRKPITCSGACRSPIPEQADR